MATQKILLPYNFTNYDQKALDFVIRTFAHAEDVEVTLFNSYTSVPEIKTSDSPIMDKLKGNLTYLSQRIREQEEGLKVAKRNLLENGFSEDQIHYVFKPRNKDIAGEIVDLALSGRYDLIVINRKPGKVTRFFTGSVLNKVASALKDTTICLVT
ncbi:MAG: universal stress protein [Deltaproteobacteria bacterium]|nr:MAG: universal stress protein [Deltaproteobacteria bacterium]